MDPDSITTSYAELSDTGTHVCDGHHTGHDNVEPWVSTVWSDVVTDFVECSVSSK